jgi:hypothetical protein
MRYKIDRLITTHKTIVIGVITTVLIILLAKNIMYFPGICPAQPSVNIIDESKRDSYIIQRYVNTISKHFATKMNQLGKCHYAELFFVYRPLISSGVEPFNFEMPKSNATRSLDSPWVKITLTNSYKPIARAAFFWNERQFLLDQALMSGAHADFTKPLLPISIDTWNQFVKEYMNARDIAYYELAMADKTNKMTIGDNIYLRTLVNHTRQLPSDIFWMFRQGSGFNSRMNEVIQQSISQYTDLTKSLIDSRFSSAQTEQSYQSVLDLKDVFNIDEYRIK